MGADQARRREAVRLRGGTHGRSPAAAACVVWWRDGPEATRACCARRVCVREAAHVRLGATMAIELAEKRKAIVCVSRGGLRAVDGIARCLPKFGVFLASR